MLSVSENDLILRDNAVEENIAQAARKVCTFRLLLFVIPLTRLK